MEDSERTLLIVDDDKDVLTSARVVLRKQFKHIIALQDPKKISDVLENEEVNLVLLDMNFHQGEISGEEGMQWLKYIKQKQPHVSVVMITAYGDVNLAVDAMKHGAVDFIVKPWDNEKLLATVHAASQLSQSLQTIQKLQEKETALKSGFKTEIPDFIGKSAAVGDVKSLIDKVSSTEANVLVLGENGTGKEVVARRLHALSNRKDEVFVHVDLGSLSENLFESELFGHVKGAFTDAKEDRAGRFESAAGGTIFLDEIGNIPLSLQTKLLKVIQERMVTRIGSNRSIPVDFRLICATNQNLFQMVDDGSFRQDLLYRVNTVELHLPPLRERITDIPLLALHFLEVFKRKYQKKQMNISNAAIDKLKRYSWPGNVRELQHIIERAVIMTENKTLEDEDILIQASMNQSAASNSLNLEEVERDTIYRALKKHAFNVSAAAKELGLGRTTMYRKMDKYGF